jgi:hypothetical protein
MKMKKKIAFLIVISTAINLAASSANAGCFSGKWKSRDPDFLLELHQRDKEISGTHLIVAQRGSKIDSSDDENDQTISGTVSGGVADVKFASSFGGSGHARLVCKNDGLVWQLIDASGAHWFPKKANLISIAPRTSEDVSHPPRH